MDVEGGRAFRGSHDCGGHRRGDGVCKVELGRWGLVYELIDPKTVGKKEQS